MFDGLLNTIVARVVQALAVAAAGSLVTDGLLTQDQVRDFEGAVFFLAMLVANHFIGQHRNANAAQAGAIAVGGAIDRNTAVAIAKGKTP